ncbi:hypothetical protein D3C86_1734800 [compost metagenome]
MRSYQLLCSSALFIYRVVDLVQVRNTDNDEVMSGGDLSRDLRQFRCKERLADNSNCPETLLDGWIISCMDKSLKLRNGDTRIYSVANSALTQPRKSLGKSASPVLYAILDSLVDGVEFAWCSFCLNLRAKYRVIFTLLRPCW